MPPIIATTARPAQGAHGLTKARVEHVVDGDTAHLMIGVSHEKVRFIGIDTPESTVEIEPFGKKASSRTHTLLDGKTVWLEFDAERRDQYGRLLAYIWLEPPASRGEDEIRTKMLNARLVDEGFAQVYTFPPNVAYTDTFVRLQRSARQAQRGLWAVEGAADPLEGRRAESSPGVSRTRTSPPTTATLAGSLGRRLVYYTANGSHYHRRTCRFAKSAQRPISALEAQKRGLTPCAVCDPLR